jgi:hypothetical protein
MPLQQTHHVMKTRFGTNHLDTATTVRLLDKLKNNPSPFLPTTSSDEKLSDFSARRLKRIFQEKRATYTGSEIMEFSSTLSYTNPKWSKVPRAYVVLRVIDCFNLLDEIIDAGFSDLLFPVKFQNLPGFMDLSVRRVFCNAQQLILIKSMNLDKYQEGQNCYVKGTIPVR